MTKPPNLADIEEQIERLCIQKDEAVKNAEYEEAARMRDQAEQLRKKKEEMQKQWKERSKEVDGVVDEEVIAEVVSKMTGIPLTRMTTEDSMRLMQMESELHKRVISQEEAIKSIFLRSVIFEEFGLRYIGPIDGHSFHALLDALAIARDSDRPILLHVSTEKGKGYSFAEEQPEKWHGASTFDIMSGEPLTPPGRPAYSMLKISGRWVKSGTYVQSGPMLSFS